MVTIMKASAGSGKTYNLAKKYITLLLKNRDYRTYRHILAVTFTNKATEEMKSRILKELHTLAERPDKSPYLKDFLKELPMSKEEISEKSRLVLRAILHDYSSFAVSTIDKFFQQTLRAFSREIGQFASYQVELDKASLVAESVDRILDSLTEEKGGLLSWLTDNVLEQIEQGGRYSMDANLLNMAVRLKSAQRQEALEAAGIKGDFTYSKDRLLVIRDSCRDIIRSFRNEVVAKARAALDVIEQAGVNPKDSNRGFMNALYDYSELTDNDPVFAPTDSFMSKASDSEIWFAKSKTKTLRDLVYPALEAPLNEFCGLWGKDFQVFNTAVILDSQIYGLGVAGELHETYLEVMKEKNVLSIDDSNTLLKDIIDGSDAPFVYEKTGVRYDHFLLDEFQDTANVQWTNFSPLLHNSESQGGENLIVGDVKQSIYRWRGSDWSLLDKKIPEEFPGYEKEVLGKNWRSRETVVNFNNEFFRKASLMLDRINGYGGDESEDADKDSSEGLLATIYGDVRQTVAKDDVPGVVSISFCDKGEELQRVLDSVREAQASGALLSDIAVLVRSNAIGGQIASFLMENGVTVITDDSLKVKGAVTVRRLVSLLSFMDNPDDTVNGYLAESLDVTAPDSCSSLTDMAESLLRSIKEGDKDELWRGEVLHIQSFMDHLQDYSSTRGNSLRGFLNYWEDENPSIASPSSGDSVRVMTIHKSKGLDFGYVIIPFAENITMYKAGDYWCAPELKGTPLEGTAEGVYDVTLSKSSESTLFAEHYHKENFLQQVDNINTLYVAMTRAVSGMHIIAKTPSSKFLSSCDGKIPDSFSDFSQMLYWFAACSGIVKGITRTDSEGMVRFDVGEMPDFNAVREEEDKVEMFNVGEGEEYPSFALNPELISDEGEVLDVCERGRLRFSAEASEFFLYGNDYASSDRIKGVVLHDILAGVAVSSDLHSAVVRAVASGEMSEEDAVQAEELLAEKIASVSDYGWFDPHVKTFNEVEMADTDGQIYRPDRVVLKDGKVTVIDYKFGEHNPKYLRQVRRYADMWRRMGYDDVSAYIWYVRSGQIVTA